MKRNFFYVGAALLSALALTTACSNDDFVSEQPAVEGNFTLTATLGGDTRTYVDGQTTKWNTGDKILVYGTNASAIKMTLSDGAGTNKGTFKARVSGNKTYETALYPAGEGGFTSSSSPSYTFQQSYTLPENGKIVNNSPMYGEITDNSTVAFQHLAGIMRITLNGVPAADDTDSAANKESKITLKGKGIAGAATLNTSTPALTVSSTDTEQTVTVDFTGRTGDLVFDIPLPAATYSEGISVALKINGVEEENAFTLAQGTKIEAGTIINMPAIGDITIKTDEITFAYSDINDAQKAIDNGAKEVTIAASCIKLNDVLTIPTTATSEETYIITIDGTPTNVLEIAGGNENTILIVNAPDASVNITGTFKEGESTTAPTTLTLKAGAKITTLKAMKGGIKVEASATVTTITVPASAEVSKIEVAASASVNKIEVSGKVTEKIEVNAAVTEIKVERGAEVADLTIAESATVTTLTNNGTVSDLNNSGTIETTTVAEGAELQTKVSTAEEWSAAIEDKNVNVIKMEADITLSGELWIQRDMTFYLGTHTLTIPYTEYANETNAVLTIIGGDRSQAANESNRGKIVDGCNGFLVYGEDCKLIMKNVNYETEWTANGDDDIQAGVTLGKKIANQTVEIDSCSFNCVHYCVATNASEPTQSGNVIKLSNSTFTCSELPLLCNINATVTAENCIFNGGSQAAFIRAGQATFDKCAFNLSKSESYSYEVMYVGDTDADTWRSGQEAPFAALLIGNRYRSEDAYAYQKNVTLTNGCTFSVKGFESLSEGQSVPAVYLDTMNADQKVTLTYDAASKTSIDEAGGLVAVKRADDTENSWITHSQSDSPAE